MSSLNILVAIPYADQAMLNYIAGLPHCRFLLDSGAFTAWKKGAEMELPYYMDFVSKLPMKPFGYFTLDKIGDSHGTKKNFEEILRNGLKPIPIFTRGERLDELDYYYSHSDLLAIGGLVGTLGNRGFVRGIMSKVAGRKVHWLGFTSSDYVGHYRPFSCDSSSWAGAVRYAKIKLYCGQGRWIVLGKEEFSKQPDPRVLEQFRIYDEDPRRLAFASEWKNSGRGDYLLEVITCKSWVRYQLDVEKTLGTKFFLACASLWQVRLMNDAFNYWTRKESGQASRNL